jgi:hypothetical protein
VIAGKSADVIVNWLPDALASREAGVPLVNIAQVYDRSGMMLTCKNRAALKRLPTSKVKRWASGTAAMNTPSSTG